jgi:hypothetical protein
MKDMSLAAEALVQGFLVAHGYEVQNATCKAPHSADRRCCIDVKVNGKAPPKLPRNALTNLHDMLEKHWLTNVSGVSMSGFEFRMTHVVQAQRVAKMRGRGGEAEHGVEEIK